MQPLFVKQTITIVVGSIALSIGLFVFVSLQNHENPAPAPIESIETEDLSPKHKVIGLSVEGRKIEARTYGNGETHLAFIGGIHGGYEWNSVLLAYQFMDYLDANPEVIPDNLSVTVIPSANPDGVYKVLGKEGRFAITDVPANVSTVPGRFNAHAVDLNRNFDCQWQPESMWRANLVSAGTAPFSEPETMAIRSFVLENAPTAVIFWHSQANAVYPAECGGDILEETRDIMNAYAKAAGYQAIETFDDYEITGAADGWLALLGIPALTVELQTHETVEWERNLAGIKALFEYYEQSK